MSELIVNHSKCNLCEICVVSCPFDALSVRGKALRVAENCELCGACVKVCPEEALHIEESVTGRVVIDPGEWRGVWVVAEVAAESGTSELAPVSLELVAKARSIADELSVELSAVVIGHALKDVTDELCCYPVDRIYRVESEELASFQSDIYAAVLSELVLEKKPEVLLCGATSEGRAFFPRVAALLHTGLTADCTGLKTDVGRRVLLQTRPAFGGNIMATIECPDYRPQMATVRPNVMAPIEPDPGSDVQIIDWCSSSGARCSPLKLLQILAEETGGAALSDADVIVAGGRGTGGQSGFDKLSKLADALGGVVGASRAAVDSGWVPYSAQIGQTGKVVQPELYIACGISGAVQHLVGMRSSGTVVAVNSDPGAPVFEVADFGFVGDLNNIIPKLTDAVKKFKSTQKE